MRSLVVLSMLAAVSAVARAQAGMAPAMHPIRHESGERAKQHHRGRSGERRHRHHERRIGELEGEPAEQDEVHPASAVDAEAGKPEPAIGALAKDLGEGVGRGQGGRRRSGAAHPGRDSTEGRRAQAERAG